MVIMKLCLNIGQGEQGSHDHTGLGSPAVHYFLQGSWTLQCGEPLHHWWAYWYLGNALYFLSVCLFVCFVHVVFWSDLIQFLDSSGDSLLTAFSYYLMFSHIPPVTRLCALLHDDAGGAVWYDISEGGQCCLGCPESSDHPTILQVSLRSVSLSRTVTWIKFSIDTSACVPALDCGWMN